MQRCQIEKKVKKKRSEIKNYPAVSTSQYTSFSELTFQFFFRCQTKGKSHCQIQKVNEWKASCCSMCVARMLALYAHSSSES